MAEIMTAKEVADQLEAKAKSYEGWAWYSGIDHAKSAQQIREHLVPRWLDEPVHPKIDFARYHYWVEGQPYPNVLQWNGDCWIINGLFGSWDSLRGRRVWPIEGPPGK